MISKVFQAGGLFALLSMSVWGCTGELEDSEYTSFVSDVMGDAGSSGAAGAFTNNGQAASGGTSNPVTGGAGGFNGVGGSGGEVASGGINGGGFGGEAQAGSGGSGDTGGNGSVGGTGGTPDVPSCEDTCSPEGETSCNGNAVVACERAQNGCLAWQTEETCGAGMSCSMGDCTQVNNCTNECNAGATLCNGTITCTNSDADPCLEWSAPPQCPEPQAACKRGIAANVAPTGASFANGVAWWYNWARNPPSSNTGSIEFAPMLWDERDAVPSATIPAGSKYVLGFNEPNLFEQANMSAQLSADLWPEVERIAATRGAKIVSTAMSYCGNVQAGTGPCHDVSPYSYLDDFFAACPGCKVDYVAVHWYNCDIPSLRNYIEGFYRFGKPIWLTEFACAINGDTSVAGQQAYMTAAVEYLENNPNVFRYSWFSADPIPQAKLINNDGSPTALGTHYINLPNNCD